MRQVATNKITSPIMAYSSKKAVVFEPPLYGSPGKVTSSKDQWHSVWRSSSIGFLDGHSEIIFTNYNALAPLVSGQPDVKDRAYY